MPCFSCLRSSFSYCSTISSPIGSLPSELTGHSFAPALALRSLAKLVYSGRPMRMPSPSSAIPKVIRSIMDVTPPATRRCSGRTSVMGLK